MSAYFEGGGISSREPNMAASRSGAVSPACRAKATADHLLGQAERGMADDRRVSGAGDLDHLVDAVATDRAVGAEDAGRTRLGERPYALVTDRVERRSVPARLVLELVVLVAHTVPPRDEPLPVGVAARPVVAARRPGTTRRMISWLISASAAWSSA